MLEPRSAIGARSSPIDVRSRVAIAVTSSSTRSSIGPSLSPWPRWSKEIAASPSGSAARAKSWWLSLQDPAPCRITIPPRAGSSGSHSV